MSAEAFDDQDLAALMEINQARSGRRPGPSDLEAHFETKFGASSRLAVYGTLAPGRSNHHQLAEVAGEWISGLVVHGELFPLGWGQYAGFPALRWSAAAPAVDVELFVSNELAEHWERLDQFEGSDYVRILVPLYQEGRVAEVANLYQAAEA